MAIGLLVLPGAWTGAIAQSQEEESPQCEDPATSKEKAAEECPQESPQSPMSTPLSGLDLHHEYRKRTDAAQEIAPLEFGLFGDQVSLYNGATTFSVHDIEIPGNAQQLPLRFSRKLAIDLQITSGLAIYDSRLLGAGNWDIDVPHLVATYPTSTGPVSCSAGLAPSSSSGFMTHEIWQGVQVNIPGEGSRKMLSLYGPGYGPMPTGPGTYRYTTAQRDVFDCTALPGGGEGIRMTTASGLVYHFTVQTIRSAALISKRVWVSDPVNPHQSASNLGRSRYYMLASKIEDRFGNTIQYTYDSNGYPTRIWANDGREILIAYSSGRVTSATSNGRTWQYQYVASGSEYNLTKVIRPDLSEWKYSYSGALKLHVGTLSETEMNSYCDLDPITVYNPYTLIATHPSGAVGTFSFSNRRHWRSGVAHTECSMEGHPSIGVVWSLATPPFFDVMSLTSKSIGGPGIPSPHVWGYDYWSLNNIQALFGDIALPTSYPCTTCDTEKTVIVTHPGGDIVHHRFGIQYWFNEGRELGSELRNASNVIFKTETNEYLSEAASSSQAFFPQYGGSMWDGSDPSSTWIRPVVKRTTIQDGRNFIWQVPATCGPSGTRFCFDEFARPIKVTKSSSP